MSDPRDHEIEERLRLGLHRLAGTHSPGSGVPPGEATSPPRRMVLVAVGACLVLLGVGLFTVNRDNLHDVPATDTETPAGTSTVPVPQTTPETTTELTSGTDVGECGEIPAPALVGADRVSVEMSLISFGDSCGFDADGEAMFDDEFRPDTVLLVGEVFRLTGADAATVVVDIRPLEPDLVLRNIDPTRDELLIESRRAFRLGWIRCAVVTVGWRTDTTRGVFTALVESENGACRKIDEGPG